MSSAVKIIKTKTDLAIWTKSEAYKKLWEMIKLISSKIVAKSISEIVKGKELTVTIRFLVDLLGKAWNLIDEYPPQTQPQRFGNRAFKDWYNAMTKESISMLREFLEGKNLLEFTDELFTYYSDSFGNPLRIDYGTGHETNILFFICCLYELKLIDQDSIGMVYGLFYKKYLDVVRRLQDTYKMEPAGSHGVWGLDDFQFLVYLFGSCQLFDNLDLVPLKFLSVKICEEYKDEYLFFGAINNIHTTKNGPFFEHSSILYSMSRYGSWMKVNRDLAMRYQKDHENDIPFEEEVLRHPYSMNSWKRYVEYKSSMFNSEDDVYVIYERALHQIPGSYKLWNEYLRLRRTQMLQKPIDAQGYEETNGAHERALIFMHKMPRIWVEYLKFMMHQRFITRTRHVFDRALRALPITQHYRIWKLYIRFITFHNIPMTTCFVYKRYLKLFPEDVEGYIDFLISVGNYTEASKHLIKVVNDNTFNSKQRKTRYQLCEIITKHSEHFVDISIPNILRYSLDRFNDGNGQLWCMLADHYIRHNLLERARDIFEEGLNSVTSVKDFGQIFEAYIQFEEIIVTNKMKEAQKSGKSNQEDKIEMELRFERLENLLDRRAILLSSVLLRQNPHNVNEWLKRAQLFKDLEKFDDVIETYEKAGDVVNHKFATGKPHMIWVEYASFQETRNDLFTARTIYERGVKKTFRFVEDLATLWCHYVEMELRNKNYDKAIRLLERATATPSKKAKIQYFDQNETIHNRLFKSLKLWSFYADLCESFSSFENTKAVYYKMIGMKVVNPQIILNFAQLLESNSYFEESFKVYEHGVSLFHWPNVYELWNTYIMKFGGTKLERIRDLFEQVLSKCPEKFCKLFYISYAQVEEKFGLTKNAISIYERAVNSVPKNQKYAIYSAYINRASHLLGVTAVRPIYEAAMENLPTDDARRMGMRYAQIELKLGEIDRCRSIFCYTAQLSNPRTAKNFWSSWQEFEINHGNPETFREMLRIKRTILAQYNININTSLIHEEKKQMDPMQAVEQLEAQAIASSNLKDSIVENLGQMQFVKSSQQAPEINKQEKIASQFTKDEDDDNENVNMEIQQKNVPTSVFGGLK